jgi:hypothetical protein
MVISEDELKEMISPAKDIEKRSKLSFDGSHLLVRVPRAIEQELKLEKGQEIMWVVNHGENKITIWLDDEE